MAVNKTNDTNIVRLDMGDQDTVGQTLAKWGKLSEDEIQKYRAKQDEIYQKKRTEKAKKSTLEIIKAERKAREEMAKEEAELRKELIEANVDEYIEYVKATTGEEISKAEAKKAQKKAQRELESEELGTNLKKLFEKTFKGGLSSGLVKSLGGALDNAVDNAMTTYTKYQSSITTRLLGTAKTFGNIIDGSTKASPFYKTSDYIENVNKLVQTGIAGNLEQRAFLETVSDKIVTTFEATNDTLLRMVRIQGEDSTATRMGMEAYLNNYLNQSFQNTEYLSKLFDSTSGYIEEATSLLTADESISAEYAIQKWLGSLYSVGMSQSAINALAQGLGQLGSGNINNLIGGGTGNLFAMASKGKLSEYLKNGLTEATVNTLMSSVVEYLSDLNKAGNNVVKSQLADVFGVSISDLRAASNLNTAGVVGNVLNSEDSLGYLSQLMDTAGSRMTLSELMGNFTDNLSFAFGSNIADSKILSGVYMATKAVEGLGLGAKAEKFTSAIKMGLLGVSALGMVKDLIGGADFTGSLTDSYNRLANTKATGAIYGAGLNKLGSNKSLSATYGDGDLQKAISDSQNLEKQVIENNNLNSEDDIEVVVPNIYKYLINQFDGKVDTLIKLASISANYSVVDTYGNNMTNLMNTVMNGNSVTVQANPVDSRSELVNSISDNVESIYQTLLKVIRGEQSLAIRDISPSPTIAYSNGVSNYTR